ncbi:MAG: VWA domain-containing protein, partial [Draconibacterium sp.]|nr:VWA domain-containing protein [Draconibacterium sp.]
MYDKKNDDMKKITQLFGNKRNYQINIFSMFSLILVCFILLFLPSQIFSQEEPAIKSKIESETFQDPDNLGGPIYIGEVAPFVLPSDNTNITLKSAKLSNLKSGNIILKSGQVSDPVWPEPGAINIEKTGEATDTYGKWKINIKVEGKNIPKATDVVLVIDDSGSMKGTKMSSAISAARNFVDELLTGTIGIRIAVVTINGGSGGNGRPQLDHDFSSDINSLKTAISSITASGGTNLQGGFYAARQLTESSSADKKVVILLSDGAPTYSYNSQISTNFNLACGSISNFNISRSDFEANHLWVTSSNYSNVVGTGGNFSYTLYSTTINCNGTNRTFNAGNHGIPTKYEADLIKSTGADIYTIGFEVPSGGSEENVLNNCQNAGYYPANSSNISNVYSTIRSNIAYAATNAVFSDPMSGYVALVTAGTTPTFSVLPSTSGDVVVSKGTVTFTNDGYVLNDPDEPDSGNSDQIKWLVTWNIGTVSENGDFMYYFVNLAPNTDFNHLYDANDETYMDYTDVNGNPGAHHQTPQNFSIPKVSKGGGSIQINYYLVNSSGQPVNSTGVVVSDPQYAHRILQNGSASSYYSFNGNISLELNQAFSVEGISPYTSADGLIFDLLNSGIAQNVFLTPQSPNQTVWFAYVCRCDKSVYAGNDISTCEGNSIDLFATFNGTPISVNWTGPNSFTSNSIDPVAFSATTSSFGEYIVTVNYPMNCIAKDIIRINVLQDTEETIYVSDCNVVVVNNIEYTESGTYIQRFTNTEGCDSTLNIIATILKNTTEFIIEKNNDVSCYGGSDGKLTVTASGVTRALTYSIDNGANYQASAVFSGLTIGTYTITIKDENNCTKNSNVVTITQPDAVIASAVHTDV